MAELINKSAVIRALHDKGVPMKIIAKRLGVRYNMVYNVVERYSAHIDYKDPVVYLEPKDEEAINKAFQDVAAEMNIIFNVDGTQTVGG